MFVLDSSAVVASYFGESGAERVSEVLIAPNAQVGLSVLTAGELWSRLRAVGAEEEFEPAWSRLTEIVTHVFAVTMPIVLKANELRRAASTRMPYVAALIAATAATHDAVLLHRDPHFASVPDHLLKQERLPVAATP